MKNAIKRIKVILLAASYVLIHYLISITAVSIYTMWNMAKGITIAEAEKNANEGAFALSVIASIICVWIYMLIYKLKHKDISEYVPSRKVPTIILMMSGCLAIGMRLLVAVYYALVQKVEIFEKSIQEATLLSPDITTIAQALIAVFSILVVAPLFEEFLFRGLVMGELLTIMRPWAAITLQALLFGIAHGVLFQSVFAFAVGIVLGIVYYRTRSIKAASVCHSMFNASAVLMQESMSVPTVLLFSAAGIILSALSLFYIFANTERR